MSATPRDRDDQGRPKNQRPRDSLGRPLPRDAKGDPSLQVEPEGTPAELMAQGVEHFNRGNYFQAHECWETAWHEAAESDRDFWQGITQIAVGLTHRGRGNLHGAKTLLRRGIDRAARYGDVHLDLEVGALVSQAREILDELEAEGLRADIGEPRAALRPR